MKLLDFILCDTIRQEVNGKFSFIGVYSDLRIPEKTADKKIVIPTSIFIRLLWEENDSDFSKIKVHISGGGSNVAIIEPDIKLKKPESNIGGLAVEAFPLHLKQESIILTFKIELFRQDELIHSLSPDYYLKVHLLPKA